MAYTRAMVTKILRDLGVTDEADIKTAVNALMDAHVEVVDGLKEQTDKYRSEVAELENVQKELDELKNKDWETRYKTEHDAFEKFKADADATAAKNAKSDAYKQLLAKSGISEKYIPQILRVTNLDSVEMDDSGTLKNADKLTESIKTEWSGFVSETTTKGAKVPTPPAKGNATMTRDQIMAITDRTERRAAIAANPQAFGIETKG